MLDRGLLEQLEEGRALDRPMLDPGELNESQGWRPATAYPAFPGWVCRHADSECSDRLTDSVVRMSNCSKAIVFDPVAPVAPVASLSLLGVAAVIVRARRTSSLNCPN